MGKLREYRELLAETGFELVAFDSEVDEVGESYAENARLKAEAATGRSGLPALGDDSGVEVEALAGAIRMCHCACGARSGDPVF